MGRFAGKVAFITGAARGQGRSHAIRFAQEGADIVALDICGPVSEHVAYEPATPEDLETTAKAVLDAGRRVVARRADVRDGHQVARVVDEAIAELGRIDVVVANAGICAFGWSWEIPETFWDAIMDTNLKGVWNTVRAAVPHMIAAGRGGSIIITSAAADLREQPFLGTYVASKVGEIGLMNVLAVELAPHRIRVNTVNPLGVNTPMATGPAATRLMETQAVMLPGAANLSALPWAEPEDVSDVVLYLASAEAEHITGVQMPIEVDRREGEQGRPG